jgi:hypothetical protein
MKRRSAPDLMVGVLQTRRCISQQSLQALLALDQRHWAQVLTVEEHQVEQEEDERAMSIGGVLDDVEGRAAIGQHTAQLAIEVRAGGRQLGKSFGNGRVLGGPVEASARQQPHVAAIAARGHSVAIELYFMRPSRAVSEL